MALKKRYILPLLVSFAIGLGAFDFAAFCKRTAALDLPVSPKGDGVVALTGGSGLRIAAGVRLIEAGAARHMLISGVNPAVSQAEIAKLGGGPPEIYICCVTLGRRAETTLGNASETASWASESGHQRLIIVTSNYHMPRSLIVLRRAMPELEFIAYPVQSSLDPNAPFANLRSLKGLGTEWVKWRITRLLYGNVEIV